MSQLVINPTRWTPGSVSPVKRYFHKTACLSNFKRTRNDCATASQQYLCDRSEHTQTGRSTPRSRIALNIRCIMRIVTFQIHNGVASKNDYKERHRTLDRPPVSGMQKGRSVT